MQKNPLEWLYGVFAQPETYLNLLYLLLAFPLGLAYFIFLVTGVSLGVGLLILWVGLLILAGVIALCWPLTLFERSLAIHLLHVEIPLASKPIESQPSGLITQIRDHLSNPITWKGIAFLLLKFPIGIAAFTLVVTLLSFSVSLALAPISYPWVHYNFGFININSMSAAAIACIIGLIATPLSLHAFNYVAKGLGILARVMLSNSAGVDLGPPETPASNPNPSHYEI